MTTLPRPTATPEAKPAAKRRLERSPREDLIALVRSHAAPGLGVTRHGSRSRDIVAIEACARCVLRSLLGALRLRR